MTLSKCLWLTAAAEWLLLGKLLNCRKDRDTLGPKGSVPPPHCDTVLSKAAPSVCQAGVTPGLGGLTPAPQRTSGRQGRVLEEGLEPWNQTLTFYTNGEPTLQLKSCLI